MAYAELEITLKANSSNNVKTASLCPNINSDAHHVPLEFRL